MLDGTTFVMRGTVLADVLDTPVPKLPMGEDINLLENFFNCGPLYYISDLMDFFSFLFFFQLT